MTNYNDGTIHGWNGGDCPVHPETVVEYWMREGGNSECKAGKLRWKHTENSGDIIAFRVIKQHVEPKVIWVNEYPAGNASYKSEEAARKAAGLFATRIAVKYQEVRE